MSNEPLQIIASDLPLAVRLSSTGDYYEFGAVYEGAFIPLGARKTGGVEKWVGIAKEQAAKAETQPATA